jgi:hypothetical protein
MFGSIVPCGLLVRHVDSWFGAGDKYMPALWVTDQATVFTTPGPWREAGLNKERG